MRALLDVNVLVALLDADHVHHDRATRWLDDEIERGGWASCAITQNGVVRVLSQAAYPSPVPPAVAAALLAEACAGRHHEWWPCEVSVLDAAAVDCGRLHGPLQVTDAYLLALAVAHEGRFVTFDRKVPLSAVRGASSSSLGVI